MVFCLLRIIFVVLTCCAYNCGISCYILDYEFQFISYFEAMDINIMRLTSFYPRPDFISFLFYNIFFI